LCEISSSENAGIAPKLGPDRAMACPRLLAREETFLSRIAQGRENRGDRFSGGHLPAFVGTVPAYFSTTFAVIGLVLLAFLRAPLADPGAEPAQLRSELRTAAHQRHAQFADAGAIQADACTIRPILADAGVRAMVTFDRACLTGFDTRTMFLVMVRHRCLSRSRSDWLSTFLRPRCAGDRSEVKLIQQEKNATAPR
jgi:hypothetical protein